MSQRPRILPILTMDGRKLVKTVRFSAPKYIGDPINALKIFNDKMVDEIIVLDISASREQRKPNFAYLHEMASECFSPLGYGGGIQTFDDAQRVFACGAEKVILNTVAYEKPDLITEIANTYGSQSVVVSIDIKKTLLQGERAFTQSGSIRVKAGIVEWAQSLEARGAGELMIHRIDRDGTFSGLERTLTRTVAQAVTIPVIAAGGAASVDDMLNTIAETGASAAAAGSIFVYRGGNTQSILISYPTPTDILP
jgi:cyclase